MACRMTRTAALLVVLLMVPVAPAAAASKDDGPYTPFPEGAPTKRAVDFVRQLNAVRPPASGPVAQGARRITPQQLAKGTKLPDPGTTPGSEKALPKAASPSGRAGVNGGDDSPAAAAIPFALVALLLAAAAIGFELRARRRPARV
jgi:hypothetical protein